MPFTVGGLKFKTFIKESDKSNNDVQINEFSKRFYQTSTLTGEKAKQFYEETLSISSYGQENKINSLGDRFILFKSYVPGQTKCNINKVPIFKNKQLLSLAQNNEIENLNKFFSLQENFDVDIVDDFGWTPLMCAAYSGAEEALKILLANGADPEKMDNLGNTPLKLARLKKFDNIVKILKNFKDSKTLNNPINISLIQKKPLFCDLCQQNITTDWKNHEASIMHNFNSNHQTSTFYSIPETNKGFQLLLKKGWNKGEGLGPNKMGRKFPIKARTKKNKNGFGSPNFINEIRDRNAHHHTNKSQNFKIKYKTNSNAFERNFRMEFY